MDENPDNIIIPNEEPAIKDDPRNYQFDDSNINDLAVQIRAKNAQL